MTNFKSPMLATAFDRNKLQFPLLASPKIDGIRCVVDKTPSPTAGLFDPYTRSGKVIRNKFVKQCLGMAHLYGLDGELVVGPMNAPDVYNTTSSGIMSEKGEPDFTFNVFDLHQYPDMPFRDRFTELKRIVMGHYAIGNDCRHIRLLEQRPILTVDEFDEAEASYIEQGYEGMMIRRPDAGYKYGRSTVRDGALLKVKRYEHDEATIIGFDEMMRNGNEAFTDELGRTKRSTAKDGLSASGIIGAFTCTAPGWSFDFNVSCGSISMAERERLWSVRDTLRGKIVRFKHLPHGAKDRPRHPLFAGFRDPDDLS